MYASTFRSYGNLTDYIDPDTTLDMLRAAKRNQNMFKDIKEDALKGLLTWVASDQLVKNKIEKIFALAYESGYDPTKVTTILSEMGKENGGKYMPDGVKAIGRNSVLYTALIRFGIDLLHRSGSEVLKKSAEAGLLADQRVVRSAVEKLGELLNEPDCKVTRLRALARIHSICILLELDGLEQLLDFEFSEQHISITLANDIFIRQPMIYKYLRSIAMDLLPGLDKRPFKSEGVDIVSFGLNGSVAKAFTDVKYCTDEWRELVIDNPQKLYEISAKYVEGLKHIYC